MINSRNKKIMIQSAKQFFKHNKQIILKIFIGIFIILITISLFYFVPDYIKLFKSSIFDFKNITK